MEDEKMYEMTSKSFLNDWEKMRDFFVMTKEGFLNFYDYLTEEEYDATYDYWNWLTDIEYAELEKTLDVLPGLKILDAAMVLAKMKLGREEKRKENRYGN